MRQHAETGRYAISVTNIFVIGREGISKTFERQAIDIKRLIQKFQPIEVVIDINGLGKLNAQVKSF